jgi:hypothetical protein
MQQSGRNNSEVPRPVHALLAGWRVSLRRTRADWPIVAAAWLITLLAATLLAGGAIYPAAAAEAGLRRALAEAPAADTVIDVSRYSPGSEARAVDELVRVEIARVLGPLQGTIVRDWRTSATVALPDASSGEPGDQAIFGLLDGLADRAALLAGAWPTGAVPAGPDGLPSEPIEVAVVEAVATALGLEVGDVVPLVARASTAPTPIPVRLVGIFAITTPTDPFWNEDAQLVSGIVDRGQYRSLGPFFASESDLVLPGVGALNQHWRTFIGFDQVGVDHAGPLRSRIAALEDRLEAGGGGEFQVATGLPEILESVERSLLVSRTGVLLLIAQLAILAAYAIVLTASLLVDHRRIDTALLRSRGAGPWQVAALALLEGLLLAIPAVLIAPWLAAAALNVLNDAGPLAAVGLRIVPHVGTDAYVAAGVAGIGCVALLVLPALLAARGFATEQAGQSRQETRTFGQRMGIDVALLALTGIALWQLRLYGAPLTQTVQGRLGIDPLLVAAPAIGMVAGGVLALRMLPLLAHAVERMVTRGRDLVLSLGSRQLSRRPLRYTRSALLLMLAMSMGVFALSYGATWSSSQRDQAAYQAAADVRVVPARSGGAGADWSLPGRYAELAGFEEAFAVERIPNRISFVGAGSADVLALDAERAGAVALVRADEATVPLGEQLGALRAGRPDAILGALPDDAAFLQIRARADIGSIERFVYDEATGEFGVEPIDPSELTNVRLRAGVVLRDAYGLLHRVESELALLAGSETDIVLPLEPHGSLELAAVGVELWLPNETVLGHGEVGIVTLSQGADAAGPWIGLPLTGGEWRAKMAPGLENPGDLPPDQVQGTTVTLSGSGQFGGIFGAIGVPSARITFVPAVFGEFTDDVPVIANRAFLESTSSAVGEAVSTTVEGGHRRLTIVGVVESFPSTDPDRPLLIFDGPTLGLVRLLESASVRAPDEWWIAAADGADEGIADALRSAPFGSTEVVSVTERTRSLSTDPVALGIIGALTLGFVVTGLFAVVGLTVSGAVSARQRRTEFALLRALGLSGRQLFGSLWLENGSIVLVSLVAGTGLGLLIGWTVLPFITVTQQATAPVPPVLVEVPWDRILVLEIVSALALGVAVLLIGGVLRRIGVGSVLRMGED